MTEYGRGGGSEPWHPADPLYGDQGWTASQTQQGQVPYGGDPQQQYAPEPQYSQEPQHQQQYAEQQYAQQQQQQYAQQQYAQQHQQYQEYPAQYPQFVEQQQGYAPPQQPTYDGQGWDTAGQMQGHGQGQAPYLVADVQTDPYAGTDPYAQQAVGAYPADAPDLYTTEDAYPPPTPPGLRHLETEAEPEAEADEAAEEDSEESALAAGGRGSGDDDGPGGGRRAGRSGRSKGGKGKQRSGAACLIAALVIVGVVGGGGYYGYSYLKARFGAAEDYAGSGSEETVDVQIPGGAGLGQMGRILKEAGVVASAQAFVDAANATGKGKTIQPGVYPLKKRMSAAAAVALMLDPSKLHVLIVPEGTRNTAVYEMIDKKLQKPAGTTRDIAQREAKNLGLPAWAGKDPKLKDPLEGFLFPARYDLGKDVTPESLLKQMVQRASGKYAELGIEAKAKELGLENPLQVVTVASLVNAEGKNHDDFRKMSEVVYNRLKKTNDVTNQKLQFDSTYNYVKNQSEINFNLKQAQAFDDPYNTHFVKGLPPGPIGNPGADALTATLDPDRGGWMFFVSVDGDKTTFTKTYEEHQKLADEFQERQAQKKNGG
ncbi:endolytic transglycosylase MltG [Streptomyces sp. RerS4]|uniref:endolytic transglycosylase MltG n=1 Tax=Streptomyces sp. RerS4 TaxID=2942449 RepID=UPI00201BA926|nr:endolytic transglycosylase MltG [Streptomyces sp. RerS4]UQX00280.1 endolytic transglycosylase MltG [Streptomyces sp. RerS4]